MRSNVLLHTRQYQFGFSIVVPKPAYILSRDCICIFLCSSSKHFGQNAVESPSIQYTPSIKLNFRFSSNCSSSCLFFCSEWNNNACVVIISIFAFASSLIRFANSNLSVAVSSSLLSFDSFLAILTALSIIPTAAAALDKTPDIFHPHSIILFKTALPTS